MLCKLAYEVSLRIFVHFGQEKVPDFSRNFVYRVTADFPRQDLVSLSSFRGRRWTAAELDSGRSDSRSRGAL